MTVGELQRTIRKRLEAEADADVRKSFERLVPGAKILGVRVPALRALAAEVKKQNPALTIDVACDLLDRLCRDRIREEVLVGTFLLARSKQRWTRRFAVATAAAEKLSPSLRARLGA